DAVPQPPERCLSRQAGIMRYCPKISKNHIFARIGKLHFGCIHTVKRLSHLPGNFHQAAY
ncbi:hypothetical protein, partial [Gemmiger sp.]|uniref:hypothetical protein n=1 Tax=Gemmiger sp. TaxID=2049027 RepID=UPI0025B9C143